MGLLAIKLIPQGKQDGIHLRIKRHGDCCQVSVAVGLVLVCK